MAIAMERRSPSLDFGRAPAQYETRRNDERRSMILIKHRVTRNWPTRLSAILLMLLVSGCTSQQTSTNRAGERAEAPSMARPAPSRTLVMAFRFESADLAWNIRDTVAS